MKDPKACGDTSWGSLDLPSVDPVEESSELLPVVDRQGQRVDKLQLQFLRQILYRSFFDLEVVCPFYSIFYSLGSARWVLTDLIEELVDFACVEHASRYGGCHGHSRHH